MNNSATLSHPNFDFLYDKEYYGEKLYTEHFTNKKLSYQEINNGIILPYIKERVTYPYYYGLIDGDGRFFTNSVLHNQLGIKAYSFDSSEIKKSSSKVIYLGVFGGFPYGHFFTDCIRRLWFLKSKEYQQKFSKYILVYIPFLTIGFSGAYRRILEILSIDYNSFVPVTEITQYEKIILPDECFFMATEDLGKGNSSYSFTDEYVAMIDTIRNYAISVASPTNYKKVYFSYSRFSNQRITGEDKLEKYFKTKGYKIIYPEKYSFDEQINMLVNCESFASTVGSCSHNSVFLRDNTDVILIPRSNYMNGYQLALDKVHNLNITYIDSSFSIFVNTQSYVGSFLLFVSSNLRKFFGDKNTKSIVSYKDFKRYFRLAFGFTPSLKTFGLSSIGADNSEAYKYYSVIANNYFVQMKTLLESKRKISRAIRLCARTIKRFVKNYLKRLNST